MMGFSINQPPFNLDLGGNGRRRHEMRRLPWSVRQKMKTDVSARRDRKRKRGVDLIQNAKLVEGDHSALHV